MASVTLVFGGARSGKSSYASRLARAACGRPLYVATARIFDGDADFENRVRLHKADRGDSWDDLEEQKELSKHAEKYRGRAVVVDCLTLWLTNFFLDEDCDGAVALQQCKDEFDLLVRQWDTSFFVVSNEIGSGVHAETKMGRDFVDAHGWLNQHVGRRAERVIMMCAGQPMQVKPPPGTPMPPAAVAPPYSPEHVHEAAALDRVLSGRNIPMDPTGYFIVRALQSDKEIVVEFHSSKTNDNGEVVDPVTGEVVPCNGDGACKAREPTRLFRGRTAKELQVRIFESEGGNGLVASSAHACYIGRELQRAEHALATGYEYSQD